MHKLASELGEPTDEEKALQHRHLIELEGRRELVVLEEVVGEKVKEIPKLSGKFLARSRLFRVPKKSGTFMIINIKSTI
jgi:hypothetical protein